MLFCGIELARRIERAEVDLIGSATRAAARRGAPGVTLPVAGGLACYADANSPMNKVVGLGFEGLPAADVLDDIERTFADHRAAVAVELCTLPTDRYRGGDHGAWLSVAEERAAQGFSPLVHSGDPGARRGLVLEASLVDTGARTIAVDHSNLLWDTSFRSR